MKHIEISELEPKIWLAKINRPEALNALNSEVLSDLQEVLTGFSGQVFSKARALIITGAGEKAFVAGADIKQMQNLTPTQAKEFASQGQKILKSFVDLKIPTIAAVNGFALGGGLELALACDFIYASENAKLGLPESSLGLIPGFGGTVRLTQRVGAAAALELMMTADAIDAKTALALGLVNKVVPPAELIAECVKTAKKIQTRGPLAVAAIKHQVQSWKFSSDLFEKEAKAFGELFGFADTKEGMTAFIEKRKAQFNGN